METLFHLNGPRILNRQEARRLLPVISKITQRAQKEIRDLVQRLELVRQINEQEATQIEDEIDVLMNQWREQVSRLGGHPKGVWIVDFDNGSGFYCWKYPEKDIFFEHGYKDGYLGRRKLPELAIEESPAAEL